MIGIKVVRNNFMNNFEFVISSLGYTAFTPKASEVGKIQPFCRKNSFFVNFSGSQRENGAFLGVGHLIQSSCE